MRSKALNGIVLCQSMFNSVLLSIKKGKNEHHYGRWHTKTIRVMRNAFRLTVTDADSSNLTFIKLLKGRLEKNIHFKIN